MRPQPKTETAKVVTATKAQTHVIVFKDLERKAELAEFDSNESAAKFGSESSEVLEVRSIKKSRVIYKANP